MLSKVSGGGVFGFSDFNVSSDFLYPVRNKVLIYLYLNKEDYLLIIKKNQPYILPILATFLSTISHRFSKPFLHRAQ